MHSYIVTVKEENSQRNNLCIPCAEIETANLVQKNLQSLFPDSKVMVQAVKTTISLEIEQEEGSTEFYRKPNLVRRSVGTTSTKEYIAPVESKKFNRQTTKFEEDLSELEEDLFGDVA